MKEVKKEKEKGAPLLPPRSRPELNTKKMTEVSSGSGSESPSAAASASATGQSQSQSQSHPPNCACGLHNMVSLFEMSRRRKQKKEEKDQTNRNTETPKHRKPKESIE